MPSAGFTASVMDAVRREAVAPPPIAFPWKRALPGMAVAALTLAFVLFVVGGQVVRGTPTQAPVWAPASASLQEAFVNAGGLWAVAALVVSFLCIRWSLTFSMRRL